MKRPLTVALFLLVFTVYGCGSQSVLFDTGSEYLFVGFDALSLPGEQVQLQARLQAGDLLQPQEGYVVRFYRDGKLFKIAETDRHGMATVSFTPEGPGTYRFTADLSPNGFTDKMPSVQSLLVACRDAEEPMLVVDLDKTLVASGFETVLIGDPQPMAGSVQVMQRLAEKHSIIYLTHRPDYFGPKSKAWLQKNNYPDGPVLLSDIEGFLSGSGEFKSNAIRQLREKFTNIEIGIGDKVSDAQSYYDNYMQSFLIMDLPASPTAIQLREMAGAMETLPDEVQVVSSWAQIEAAIFEGEKYPRSAAQKLLSSMADAIESAAPEPAKN